MRLPNFKRREKPGGQPHVDVPPPSPQATRSTPALNPQTLASDSGSAGTSSNPTAIIGQPPCDQIVPSLPRLGEPSPSSPSPALPLVQSSAQLTTSSATSSTRLSNNDTAFQDPWIRAYEIAEKREPDLMADYKKHLASLQENAASIADLSTPRSVESIVNRLWEDREKKQWRVSLRGKDIKIREQAERLAKFLLWSDKIVQDAVSAQPYAALVWSGVSMLLPLLTSGTTQNEAMLVGFNSISDIQLYWKLCEKTYLQSTQQKNYQDLIEPLARLYSFVIEYQARAICHLSSAHLSRAWKNVTGWDDWDGKATYINDLSKQCTNDIQPLQAEEIRKHRDSLLRAIQESQDILDEIRHIVKEDGKHTQRNYEDQKERDLLQDLTADYEGYKDFNPPRVQGTCEWFFMDDRFRKWRDSNTSSLLWVSAGPGCGKSVLSRALIDERQLSTSVTTPTIRYFFFKDGYESRMHSSDALCTILHQLFTHDPTSRLIRHALPIHRKHGKQLTQNFSELWRILAECADSPDAGEIVCVLDALDECNAESRRQLIDKLKGFYCQPHHTSKSSSKLNFLITSRPYDTLEALFKNFTGTTAYLRFDGDDKSDQIGREIDLVIDARVDDIASGFADKDRRKISNRLKSMQNRTYLWLHLTFDIIQQSPSDYGRLSDIETLLSNLPSQVSEAYERILGRSKNQTQTEILLQIVLAAARPLTLDEANIALTLALRKQQFAMHAALESEMWPREPRDSFKSIVKNLCGLFINVYDSKLSFIHQTAREFLIHSNSQGDWKGRLNVPKSHSTISRSCFDYFSLKDFAAPIQSDSSDEKYPFLPYAADNWLFHYISQEAAAADESRKDARMLCNMPGPQAKLWIKRYYYRSHVMVAGWTDLALASYFGLAFVVDDILTQEVVDIDARGWRDNGTALHAASANGHEKVVKLLLGKGADIHTRHNHDQTALYIASVGGHEKIVELLLGKGADIHARNNIGWTPLDIASAQGHEQVVELLLDRGADVHARDTDGETALHQASIEEHEKVVKLLLDKGADVNARSNDGETALYRASDSGYEKVVWLLLDKGADIHARSNDGKTALYIASDRGHGKVVELLLDKGANVHARTRSGRTPLHQASSRGHEKIIELLLDKGADVHARNNIGWTPLDIASKIGYEKVVELLHRRGATL